MVPGQPRHGAEISEIFRTTPFGPFSSSVQIDVSGLSHPGKVRARNEDHFIVTRIGRYLETVLTPCHPGRYPNGRRKSATP